ncbi:MAG: hypothetical protein ABJP70_06385 [Erythrobacter sp.]
MRALTAGLAMLAVGFAAGPALATKQKVNVVGVPADAERIEGTKCVFAGVCFSKKRDAYTYDPGVWGMAKFYQGEVTLRDGTTLNGRVAALGTARDWNFIKRILLVIPEGEVDAIYLSSTDALLITQQTKKELRTYDRYDGAYLRRLVSGKMRLSYNPSAGTSRPLSDFLPAGTIASLSGAVGRQGVIDAIKSGRTVEESLTEGTSAGRALGQALSSIEITEKEYLLYDESADTLTAITKANYESALNNLFARCTAADAKTRKGFRKYKKIVEAVEFFNASC